MIKKIASSIKMGQARPRPAIFLSLDRICSDTSYFARKIHLHSGVTMGPHGPAAAGPRQLRGPRQKGPLSSRIGRDGELGVKIEVTPLRICRVHIDTNILTEILEFHLIKYSFNSSFINWYTQKHILKTYKVQSENLKYYKNYVKQMPLCNKLSGQDHENMHLWLIQPISILHGLPDSQDQIPLKPKLHTLFALCTA